METSARTPRGTFTIRNGVEGPKHDPYGYTEYTWKAKNGEKITLHCGMRDILSIGSNKKHIAYEDTGRKIIADKFTELVGISPRKLFRAIERANHICKNCGSTHIHTESGYPGETFYICGKCGNIIGGYFCVEGIL